MNWSQALCRVVFCAIVLIDTSEAADLRGALVVILHTGDTAMVAEMSAELTALGLVPLVLDDAPNTDLSEVARSRGAVAGMRLSHDGMGVEVWVSDLGSGVNVATAVGVESRSDRSDALLTLKAVELVRAGLMRIETEAERPPPTPTLTPKPKPPPILSFGVEPAATWGFSELPVTLHLHIRFHLRLMKGLGLRLCGFVPTLPMRISAAEGVAEGRVGSVALGLIYEILPPTARLQPSLGISLGPALLRMRGRADGDYRDGDARLVFPMATGTAGVAVSLNRVLSIRFDLLAGVALKRPVIRFDNRNVTDWGRPVLSGMTGIEAWLF